LAYCAVQAFSEPDDYAASIRMGRTEMTLVGRGQFAARLIDINLHNLRIQRFYETLPRVAHTSLACGHAAITFCTRAGPPLFSTGVEIRPDRIVRHGEGQEVFQRSTGSACWGAISFSIEAMMSAGATNADRDLARPGNSLPVAPSPVAMARLQHLHAAIAALAADTPEAFDDPEAGHSSEQALVEAVVVCLGGAEVEAGALTLQHQGVVMRRFRRAMERHVGEPVYIPELCAEIGVSDRTLRVCCQAQLGVGPHRYLMLRRLHLARRALLNSAPALTTITDIATRYGFWQFGRFAHDYRTLFGELPSTTLARLHSSQRCIEASCRN
jgi:AraC-like DNA-binding protein